MLSERNLRVADFEGSLSASWNDCSGPHVLEAPAVSGLENDTMSMIKDTSNATLTMEHKD
jgi:hypothetical protein